jgi:homoserine O-acetyltransferase
VLGGAQGTTGPSSLDATDRPFGSRFPQITIRDQVAIEVALASRLGIDVWHAIVGGSMGAMRALEWAIAHPSRVATLVLLAIGAASTADEIAQSSLQIRAIKADRNFFGGDYYEHGAGPREGLAIARGIGHFTYRTADEFDARFSRNAQGGEDPLVGG